MRTGVICVNVLFRRLGNAALLLLAAVVPAHSQILVSGAGATFPYPIYSKWFDEFHRLHPEARINYQPIGSGGGLRQVQDGTVDFGATDAPLSDQQIAALKNPVLHFPTVLGGVVPVYNLPGIARELNFTPEALAGIFLGTIRTWNHPALAGANPGVKLPEAPLVPVHRADSSGTTFAWTEFLSKTNEDWKRNAGAGMTVNWPVGLGARGNGGVAGMVKQTPYAVGYVELVYALENRLSFGRVRNAAGRFVRARTSTIAAAADAFPRLPDDFRISITNAGGENSYPISSYTWLLTPARIEDPGKRTTITAFLRWMLVEGQRMAEPLGYAPLPVSVAAEALKAVPRIQ